MISKKFALHSLEILTDTGQWIQKLKEVGTDL